MPLILDAGDTFFASPVLAAGNVVGDKKQAEGLLIGYETVGCDVLNVGGFDLAAGLDFLTSLICSGRFFNIIKREDFYSLHFFKSHS